MLKTERLSWWFGLAAMLAAVVLLVGAAGLAAWHAHDLSGVRHVTGVWMALAQYFNHGTAYPDLVSDGYFAGTRYMPAFFVLIAQLARPLGDYLFAAKLSAMISVALLLSIAAIAGRRVSGRWSVALALTGLILAFPQGLDALLTPHADALAVACALAGLLLIDTQRPTLSRALLASLLFVAALATKPSSIAGPAAAVVFLWVSRQRRPAVAVFVTVAALSAAGLQALSIGTDGRFLANFRALGSGGMSSETLLLGPARFALALGLPSGFALVWPLTFIALWMAFRARRFGLYEWYLLLTFVVTMLIFTSPGTDPNHLLELQVAAILVVGRCLEAPWFRSSRVLLWAIILAALLWGVQGLAMRGWTRALSAEQLSAALPPDLHLLSEDASVPVLLGQRPIVMDPFAFRVLAERGLVDDGDLASRLDQRQFDVIVMMGRVDIEGESLCPRLHFGQLVTSAVKRNYRFDRQVGGYSVYSRR